MANHEFRELLGLYIAKGLDPAQKKRLADLLQDPANESLLEEEMRESFFEQGMLTEASDETVDKVMEALQPRLSGGAGTKKVFSIIRWAVAAAVLLVVAGMGWWFVRGRHGDQAVVAGGRAAAAGSTTAILPARKGAAILRLANGQEIHIDSAAPGVIARQGNVEIVKGSNGEISYRGGGPDMGEAGRGSPDKGKDRGESLNTVEAGYNEVITIKGQVLTLTLPDGTVASLNTASSLRYPLVFHNGEREITMTGEVHFRVAHNEKMPFRVQVRGLEIEDIGTEFDINAYEDEPVMRTTLVEGSVRIKKGQTRTLLQPGEEATVLPGKDAIKVSRADMDLNLAWYKGTFSCRHANIPMVMREFARWYNIEVRYEKGVAPAATFTGDMGRDLTLNEALDGLKKIGINYRIDENKYLTILP